jgi:hypothetical protein
MNLNNGIKKNWSWIEECQLISEGIRRRVLEHTITHGGYLSQL